MAGRSCGRPAGRGGGGALDVESCAGRHMTHLAALDRFQPGFLASSPTCAGVGAGQSRVGGRWEFVTGTLAAPCLDRTRPGGARQDTPQRAWRAGVRYRRDEPPAPGWGGARRPWRCLRMRRCPSPRMLGAQLRPVSRAFATRWSWAALARDTGASRWARAGCGTRAGKQLGRRPSRNAGNRQAGGTASVEALSVHASTTLDFSDNTACYRLVEHSSDGAKAGARDRRTGAGLEGR